MKVLRLWRKGLQPFARPDEGGFGFPTYNIGNLTEFFHAAL
jgi:hypothetical protein